MKHCLLFIILNVLLSSYLSIGMDPQQFEHPLVTALEQITPDARKEFIAYMKVSCDLLKKNNILYQSWMHNWQVEPTIYRLLKNNHNIFNMWPNIYIALQNKLRQSN